MVKRRKQTVKAESDMFDDRWLGYKLPIVRTFKDCRSLGKDHWQGIDVESGATMDVRGGSLPKNLRLLAFTTGGQLTGLIRLIPAPN